MVPIADILYFKGSIIDFAKAIVLTWARQYIAIRK